MSSVENPSPGQSPRSFADEQARSDAEPELLDPIFPPALTIGIPRDNTSTHRPALTSIDYEEPGKSIDDWSPVSNDEQLLQSQLVGGLGARETDNLKSRLNDEDLATLGLYEEDMARTLRDTEDAARIKMSLDSEFFPSGLFNSEFMESHKKGKAPASYLGLRGVASPAIGEQQFGNVFPRMADKLHELAIKTRLVQANMALLQEKYTLVGEISQEAYSIAEDLNYKPLIARCAYYKGIAQLHAKDYTNGLHSFVEARRCVGHYIEGRRVEEYVRKAMRREPSTPESPHRPRSPYQAPLPRAQKDLKPNRMRSNAKPPSPDAEESSPDSEDRNSPLECTPTTLAHEVSPSQRPNIIKVAFNTVFNAPKSLLLLGWKALQNATRRSGTEPLRSPLEDTGLTPHKPAPPASGSDLQPMASVRSLADKLDDANLWKDVDDEADNRNKQLNAAPGQDATSEYRTDPGSPTDYERASDRARRPVQTQLKTEHDAAISNIQDPAKDRDDVPTKAVESEAKQPYVENGTEEASPVDSPDAGNEPANRLPGDDLDIRAISPVFRSFKYRPTDTRVSFTPRGRSPPGIVAGIPTTKSESPEDRVNAPVNDAQNTSSDDSAAATDAVMVSPKISTGVNDTPERMSNVIEPEQNETAQPTVEGSAPNRATSDTALDSPFKEPASSPAEAGTIAPSDDDKETANLISESNVTARSQKEKDPITVDLPIEEKISAADSGKTSQLRAEDHPINPMASKTALDFPSKASTDLPKEPSSIVPSDDAQEDATPTIESDMAATSPKAAPVVQIENPLLAVPSTVPPANLPQSPEAPSTNALEAQQVPDAQTHSNPPSAPKPYNNEAATTTFKPSTVPSAPPPGASTDEAQQQYNVKNPISTTPIGPSPIAPGRVTNPADKIGSAPATTSASSSGTQLPGNPGSTIDPKNEYGKKSTDKESRATPAAVRIDTAPGLSTISPSSSTQQPGASFSDARNKDGEKSTEKGDHATPADKKIDLAQPTTSPSSSTQQAQSGSSNAKNGDGNKGTDKGSRGTSTDKKIDSAALPTTTSSSPSGAELPGNGSSNVENGGRQKSIDKGSRDTPAEKKIDLTPPPTTTSSSSAQQPQSGSSSNVNNGSGQNGNADNRTKSLRRELTKAEQAMFIIKKKKQPRK